MTLALTLMLSAFCGAQTGKRANEEAAKRTEAVRQKVSKLGTGAKAVINVELFDGKRYIGQINRVDDTSFDVVDQKNQTSTIKYGDVKDIRQRAKITSLQKGILIGVAATVGILVLVFIHRYCNNEGC